MTERRVALPPVWIKVAGEEIDRLGDPLATDEDALPAVPRIARAQFWPISLTATELIEFQSIKRRNGDAMRHAQRAVASNLIELHLIPAAKSDQNIKPAGR